MRHSQGSGGEKGVYPRKSGKKPATQKGLVREGLHLFREAQVTRERMEDRPQSGVPEGKVGKGFLHGEG